MYITCQHELGPLACAVQHSSGCTADLPSAHPEPPFCCWPSSAAPQAACNTQFSECQVFLSCRTPCGPRSFFRCTIIQNPYAYNSIATLAKHKTCNLNISCIITSKQSSSLLVATKDESELSHGQTVSWTCPTCCLRAPAVDKLKMSKQV